jgi:organic radical activating enzyme
MEIPAQIIREEHGVWMLKQCPIHGQFTGLVERDPLWFDFCEKADAKNIYNGLLIDVTSRCQLKCKYCYHETGNDNYIPDIVHEAVNNKTAAPFILTGGEPTLHPNLDEIIHEVSKHGETWVLTNGIKLCNEDYFTEVTKELIHDGVLYIGLSFHKESMGKDLLLLDLLRKKNLKLGTAFYVIDDLKQIDCALSIYRDNLDVMSEIRIKAASNLWSENHAVNKIYTSDMLKYLSSIGKTEIDTRYNNKVSYANVIHDGLNLKLISWYDKWNIDLVDINCPPFYKSSDGNYYNMVTACLKNKANELKIISSQEKSPMYQTVTVEVMEYAQGGC